MRSEYVLPLSCLALLFSSLLFCSLCEIDRIQLDKNTDAGDFLVARCREASARRERGGWLEGKLE